MVITPLWGPVGSGHSAHPCLHPAVSHSVTLGLGPETCSLAEACLETPSRDSDTGVHPTLWETLHYETEKSHKHQLPDSLTTTMDKDIQSWVNNEPILKHSFRHLKAEGRRQKITLSQQTATWGPDATAEKRQVYGMAIPREPLLNVLLEKPGQFRVGLVFLLWKHTSHCIMEETEETLSSRVCRTPIPWRLVVCHSNITYTVNKVHGINLTA